MLFSKTRLDGVWLIDLVRKHDDRGFFGRTFCVDEYAANGLEVHFGQHSLSYSRLQGTVRGMHFQRAPHAEVKVVSCVKGAIRDVLIDLRADSPSYCRWAAFDLTAENRRQLYIPAGFAHGFQSLCDDVEVSYLISGAYAPNAATGVRHDDPTFGVEWPLPPTVMSEADRTWPDFSPSHRRRS